MANPKSDNKAVLERELGKLAGDWRNASPANKDKIAGKYREVLERLLDLGIEYLLDVDAELPDTLMPSRYIALRRQFSLEVSDDGHILSISVPGMKSEKPKAASTNPGTAAPAKTGKTAPLTLPTKLKQPVNR